MKYVGEILFKKALSGSPTPPARTTFSESMHVLQDEETESGPEVIKLFPFSTQLSMNYHAHKC